MEKIAFIAGSQFYYWSSIITVLGAAAAVCLFWGFALRRNYSVSAIALVVPLAVGLSLVLGRLAHWYCRANSYAGFLSAMTPGSPGGFALVGVFAGCVLAALAARLLKCTDDLPGMLDCMCLAGSAGIAVGRLACCYSAADRGGILPDGVGFPWASPVLNQVSGAMENRLATFALQAMAGAVIFLVLLAFFLGKKRRSGDGTLVFFLLYGASQVVLDSTRYDSLYLRSNGFVSVVQILGAVSIAACAGIYSVQLVKSKGFQPSYLGLWALLLACMAGAGYMEYYVQRHGSEASFAYSVMSLCLVGCVGAVLLLRRFAHQPLGYFQKSRVRKTDI